MKALLKLACVTLITAGVADAGEYYAQLELSTTNVFLGEVFTADVIVKAPELPSPPVLGRSESFNITPLEQGMATSASNTFLFRYAVRAKKEGRLVFPILEFSTQGERLRTKQAEIHAYKPEESDRMRLESTLSQTSVYVGEPVLLTTTWDSTYQFGALKAVDFHHPVLTDKRFQILDPYNPGQEKHAQSTGLPVQGTRILASRKSYKEGDIQHQALTFSKILIPKESGNQIIAPSTLLCAAEKEKNPNSKQGRRSAFQYPSYFDNTFFDQNVTHDDYIRIYAESAPVTLEVKPLPAEGRPALFNGMVGSYTIEVAAEPTAVRVGEPVTLTITISASEFMENIFFEPLRYQPNLINHFEIPSDRSLPQRSGKSKTYTQTIRPLSTAVDQVPPIQLAYFNPPSNAYFTAESSPVPLAVSPADPISTYGDSSAPAQHGLRQAAGGIRHNYESPDMLNKQRAPLFGWAHPVMVLVILILPPLVMGGLLLISLFGEKKHHIQRTAKAARAFKAYRKNATHIIRAHSSKREIYSDLDDVVRAYLGDRLHLNPGALTFRDAERLLADEGVDPKLLGELKDLFMLCEAYCYTEGYDEPADAKKIVHGATAMIRTVERSLK